MGVHPQNNLFNPAIQHNSSYLTLGISTSGFLDNSSLTFNDMLTKKEVNGVSDVYWDFETIDKKLRDKNYVHAGFSITPVFLGFKMNNEWALNFSASLKNSTSFKYPGSISRLRYGNADLERNEPRTIDLNYYSFDELSYYEFSLGLSKQVTHDFSIGVHAKALLGLSAVKTNRFLASVETSDDFSQSVLMTDISMDVSGPLFEVDRLNQVFDSQMDFADFLSGEEALSSKNMGLAFDLGFTYRLHEKWDVYGSILDLGYIKWGFQPQRLVSNDRYLFEGAQFSPYIVNQDDFDFSDYLKQYADTVASTIIPVSKSEAFKTRLFPKTYFGTTYQHSGKIRFNALFSSTKYRERFWASGTIGTTWMPAKKLEITGTVSYSNFSLYNLGLGLLYNTKWFQLYLVTDNINSIDVRNSRGLNLAFGLNFSLWEESFQKSMDGKRPGR